MFLCLLPIFPAISNGEEPDDEIYITMVIRDTFLIVSLLTFNPTLMEFSFTGRVRDGRKLKLCIFFLILLIWFLRFLAFIFTSTRKPDDETYHDGHQRHLLNCVYADIQSNSDGIFFYRESEEFVILSQYIRFFIFCICFWFL